MFPNLTGFKWILQRWKWDFLDFYDFSVLTQNHTWATIDVNLKVPFQTLLIFFRDIDQLDKD